MITEYDINITLGQTIGKVLDLKDTDDYIKGELDEEIMKIFERSMFLKMKVIDYVAKHPILSLQLDPKIKYKLGTK